MSRKIITKEERPTQMWSVKVCINNILRRRNHPCDRCPLQISYILQHWSGHTRSCECSFCISYYSWWDRRRYRSRHASSPSSWGNGSDGAHTRYLRRQTCCNSENGPFLKKPLLKIYRHFVSTIKYTKIS